MRDDKKLCEKIRNSISKGLEFLYNNQLMYGEFKTYISPSRDMKINTFYVSTTYITSFIIYSLSFIDSPLVSEITKKAINFFISEMESPSIWRFFGVNRNIQISNGSISKYTSFGIPPDLDDTACVSFCLKINKVNFNSNIEVFLNNRNENGIFQTWLIKYPKRIEYNDSTFYLEPKTNDICCGVNANVLLYLGETEYTLKTIEYLNQIILNDNEESNIPYFQNRFSFYYLISRAYFNKVTLLERSKDSIIEKLLSMQLKDGSFGSVLNTAFAVCTFINFDFYYDKIGTAIEFILTMQQAEGNWLMESLCIDNFNYYYGSHELTTAICLEILSRLRVNINEKNT